MRNTNNTSPLITVYIPSHNYGRYVDKAIESVLKQTVSNWELILINDGSIDNTQEIFNLYQNHPKISVYEIKKIGLPGACNFAIEKSRGEYIIRLDADDVFDENILLILSHYLSVHSDVALVFPDYYLFDENGEIFAQERRRKLYASNHLLDMPPNGACTMIKKSVLLALKGYREDLGAQDGFDLWTKIIKQYKCANVNLPLFYYRRHGNNLTSNQVRIYTARQQIKEDSAKLKLAEHRPVIAVIPIRKYYDFVLDLWKQELDNQSLLYRDIEICTKSNLFDYIIVACDNPEAEQTVLDHPDPRLKFFLRDPKSTLRTSSVASTLEKIAHIYDPEHKGIFVLRYIQTPFVSTSTLEEAVHTLAFSNASSACGVEQISSELFKRSAYGLQTLNPNKEFYSDFDLIFRDAQSCLASRSSNFTSGSLTGAAIASFEVSAAECFFISSEKDLKVANLLANANRNEKSHAE